MKPVREKPLGGRPAVIVRDGKHVFGWWVPVIPIKNRWNHGDS